MGDDGRDAASSTNDQQKTNIMVRKKKKVTVKTHDDKFLHRCYDCVYWHRNEAPNEPDAVDFSTGRCDHNGYSKVPPLFTCNGWASGKD